MDEREGSVLVRGAHRELVHGELAEQDGPGGLEASDRGAVIGRLEALQDLRAGRRFDALLAEEILQRDRHTIERRERGVGLEPGVGGGGLLEGLRRADPEEGMDLRIDALDSAELGLRDLDSRELARVQLLRELGEREIEDRGSHPGSLETIVGTEKVVSTRAGALASACSAVSEGTSTSSRKLPSAGGAAVGGTEDTSTAESFSM